MELADRVLGHSSPQASIIFALSSRVNSNISKYDIF
jgi:hypothetical protein